MSRLFLVWVVPVDAVGTVLGLSLSVSLSASCLPEQARPWDSPGHSRARAALSTDLAPLCVSPVSSWV